MAFVPLRWGTDGCLGCDDGTSWDIPTGYLQQRTQAGQLQIYEKTGEQVLYVTVSTTGIAHMMLPALQHSALRPGKQNDDLDIQLNFFFLEQKIQDQMRET